jgi:hypothetical protein
MSQRQSFVDHNINQQSGNSQNDGKALDNTPPVPKNVFNSDGNFWKPSGGSVNLVQQMKPDISTLQMPKNSSGGKGVSSMMDSSKPTINLNQHQIVVGQT